MICVAVIPPLQYSKLYGRGAFKYKCKAFHFMWQINPNRYIEFDISLEYESVKTHLNACLHESRVITPTHKLGNLKTSLYFNFKIIPLQSHLYKISVKSPSRAICRLESV